MNVATVCSSHLIHIPSTCTLKEAAVQMRDKHVGMLLVDAGPGSGGVIGVVTDRDIVLYGVAKGASADTAVEQVMTRVVETVDGDAPISDAMLEMCTHGVRRLGVTGDGGELIGVLSIDDVITALGSDWALLAGILRSETERERSGTLPRRPA